MMSTAESVVQGYYEAINRADWAALDGCVSAEYAHHTPGFPPGLRAFKRLLIAYHAAFPDLTNIVQEMICADDRVIVRVQTRGTHRAPFLGHAPTNRAFVAQGIDIFRLADNQIIECHSVFDTFSMLQQLGLHRPA